MVRWFHVVHNASNQNLLFFDGTLQLYTHHPFSKKRKIFLAKLTLSMIPFWSYFVKNADSKGINFVFLIDF